MSKEIAGGVLKAADVNEEEAALITHGNAERVFRWKIADPGPEWYR
jgi:hypothetical protein